MKKIFLVLSLLSVFVTSSYATVIFSDNFEGDLSQWTGKSGGEHHAQIVIDPLDNSNSVMNFNRFNSAGDIFTSTSTFSTGSYWLSFDYLGNPNGSDIINDSTGGYVGISAGLPGNHKWKWATGTTSLAADVLIDDGQWHSYMFAFSETDWDFHLMFEEFFNGSYIVGDAYLDNISLSDTAPVPEPTTMLLFGLGLLGLAGVKRRKK